MSKLVLGYANYGPVDGVGPFDLIFDYGVSLANKSNLDGIDGIVLWGGEDISPSLYNSKPISNSGPTKPSRRDLFEWELISMAVRSKIPIIGVCRGAQMLCAFAGGKLVQHVSGHSGAGWHEVNTFDNKILSTTSCHHQMMYPYEVPHKLLAWCEEPLSRVYQPDNTLESSHYEKKVFKEPEVVYFSKINGFGVQGHPEWQKGSKFNDWLLDQIVNHCFNKEVECT